MISTTPAPNQQGLDSCLASLFTTDGWCMLMVFYSCILICVIASDSVLLIIQSRIQNLMLYPSLSDPWRTVWLAVHSYNCWILTVCRRKRETGLNSWHHHRAASSPLGYPCPMTAVWKLLVTVIQFSSCQSLHSLRVSVSLYIITLLTALLYPRHSGATIKNSTVVQN